MTRTEKMGISLTTHPYKATNSSGGVAKSVQRARSTAGRLPHTVKLLATLQEGALSVQGKGFVSATLCILFVLISLLTLTLNRMVSVLLKSQVQQALSIGGCQMSLEPKSGLWLSALGVQRERHHSC